MLGWQSQSLSSLHRRFATIGSLNTNFRSEIMRGRAGNGKFVFGGSGCELRAGWLVVRPQWRLRRCGVGGYHKTTRTHPSSISSSIRPSQQDSLLYTQFFRTHPSSISSSIHSIHCETDLSLYLNRSMCDLVLKDLLRRI
jgi:hypothetical protein